MSRPMRVEFPGACCYVTNRTSSDNKWLFRDDEDRRRFLGLLSVHALKNEWILHGYCLLIDHFHLVVETASGDLSRGISTLQAAYAGYYNRKYDRHGHLFANRFRSVIFEKEGYLPALCRHAILNPVRLGLCMSPENWTWSSHCAGIGKGGGNQGPFA